MSRINADIARDQGQDDPIRSSIEQDNNQSDQSDAFYCCSSDMCVLVQRLGLVKQIKRFSWHRRTNLNGLNVTLSASTCTNLSAYLVSSRVQRGIGQVLLKAESLFQLHINHLMLVIAGPFQTGCRSTQSKSYPKCDDK